MDTGQSAGISPERAERANWDKFVGELAKVINYFSYDSQFETPDHILAEYAAEAMSHASMFARKRENWFTPKPPAVSEFREHCRKNAINLKDDSPRDFSDDEYHDHTV